MKDVEFNQVSGYLIVLYEYLHRLGLFNRLL